MATFVKVRTGWKAVVRRRGWPTVSRTFRLKSDAQDWARSVEDEMRRGVFIDRRPAASMTLDEALDLYLSEVTPTKGSSARADREPGRAKPLRAALGKYALAAITSKMIAQYRDTRLQTVSERTGRPISPNTVRLELALLSHLYNTAIREWDLGLAGNPVSAIRKPSPGPGRNRRITWKEWRQILTACRRYSNPMLGWIVRIAAYTGMRKSEILSLRLDQVDLDRRLVRLTKTKNGTARTVPLSRRATRVFRQALNNPARPSGTDLLFPGNPGRDGEIRPYQIDPVWRRMIQERGIRDLHFHDLRHEAVSRFVEKGLSDQEVSAISGHKSMQMLRRYTHLRAEELAKKLG